MATSPMTTSPVAQRKLYRSTIPLPSKQPILELRAGTESRVPVPRSPGRGNHLRPHRSFGIASGRRARRAGKRATQPDGVRAAPPIRQEEPPKPRIRPESISSRLEGRSRGYAPYLTRCPPLVPLSSNQPSRAVGQGAWRQPPPSTLRKLSQFWQHWASFRIVSIVSRKTRPTSSTSSVCSTMEWSAAQKPSHVLGRANELAYRPACSLTRKHAFFPSPSSPSSLSGGVPAYRLLHRESGS